MDGGAPHSAPALFHYEKIPVTKTSVRKHTVIAGTQPTKRNRWYGMVCSNYHSHRPNGGGALPKKGGAGTACLKGTKARAPAPGK